MASIIPGYEYDIFISYRQKDNKRDGWVTEFVDNLKGELESTIKEEISVYFDINPHDGLLETHDVDASLKDKLKCLVFIPIISRTYCDPKSFAWDHEFKAFVELSSHDQFGLKVKLPNGNVANRVLPIRIHDLEINDIKLCESIIAGVLRGVEFIYKEPGVNRPLTPKDNEEKNSTKTNYRNQINKVANAIDEVINGLKNTQSVVIKEKTQANIQHYEVFKEEKTAGLQKTAKFSKRKVLSIVAVLAILIIALVLAYPNIFRRDTIEKFRSSGERISLVVMPFQNMSNNSTWNNWQDGVQEYLIGSLSESEELNARNKESINHLIQSKGLNYASLTPALASAISKKLDADIFIYGSIRQAGPAIILSAQLSDSETEEVFKSFQIIDSAKEEKILDIIGSLSVEVKNFLIISKLKQKENPDYRQLLSTNSPVAYKYYISGKDAFDKQDYATAREQFSEAIKNDSNFTFATIMLSVTYLNLGLFEVGRENILRAYKKRDQMSMYMKSKLDDIHAWYTVGPQGRIKYLRQLLDFDDQDPTTYLSLGNSYRLIGQYDKAIPEFEKALDIYKKWGSKPASIFWYDQLGYAYHNTGQYDKEKKLYKKAEKDFPDDPSIIHRQAVLALSEGDTTMANRYIEKIISIIKANSWSEADIATNLAALYSEAGNLEKAEKYYRQTLKLAESKSDNSWYLNNFAYFLIYKDRNINEGMELVNKALVLSPDNYHYLDVKGWGLYKQGKYQDALEILQRSWDLRREKDFYNHEAYLHLEAAKKAVANQK